MKRSGFSDLPLHGGHVPPWLAKRMERLGGAITEALVIEYGISEVLRRLSDPFWFQALGSVMGMDWHSSGITTSVMGALKKALNPRAHELGIYICGGRGRHSRQTPAELLHIAEKTGMDGELLVNHSRLTAKVDNNLVQDGFQLYLHNFILASSGEWAIVQQGMNGGTGMARRYHWHSPGITSFVEEPHTGIAGQNQGLILDLTNRQAEAARKAMLDISKEPTVPMIQEIKKLVMPRHHDVKVKDVDIRRLGAVLALAYETRPADFESMLLLEGVGPRTIQSLALVSEVIYGTPSRFRDPARFSFAHGGKDGHPFPVPTKVYDETIHVLEKAVDKAKLGETDRQQALKQLHNVALHIEKDFIPQAGDFDRLLEKERNESYKYGGRTVFGKAKKPEPKQVKLF